MGGGDVEDARDRRCCATCRHVRRLASRPARFACGRLGWETRPEWRFNCWVERPADVKMAVAAEAGGDPDGSEGSSLL